MFQVLHPELRTRVRGVAVGRRARRKPAGAADAVRGPRRRHRRSGPGWSTTRRGHPRVGGVGKTGWRCRSRPSSSPTSPTARGWCELVLVARRTRASVVSETLVTRASRRRRRRPARTRAARRRAPVGRSTTASTWSTQRRHGGRRDLVQRTRRARARHEPGGARRPRRNRSSRCARWADRRRRRAVALFATRAVPARTRVRARRGDDRRRWSSCAGASTASRSRSSWRRPGRGAIAPARSSSGSTSGSGCSPVGAAPRWRATRRSASHGRLVVRPALEEQNSRCYRLSVFAGGFRSTPRRRSRATTGSRRSTCSSTERAGRQVARGGRPRGGDVPAVGDDPPVRRRPVDRLGNRRPGARPPRRLLPRPDVTIAPEPRGRATSPPSSGSPLTSRTCA